MHLHTDQGVAVSAQKDGLLPLSQTALIAMHDLSYHDYEGVALDHDERERIVADMGQTHAMILRNHGTLTVGENAAEAYLRMFFLERACSMQVMAQSSSNLIHCDGDLQERVAGQSTGDGMAVLADKLVWPALLRKLQRDCPGFDS